MMRTQKQFIFGSLFLIVFFSFACRELLAVAATTPAVPGGSGISCGNGICDIGTEDSNNCVQDCPKTSEYIPGELVVKFKNPSVLNRQAVIAAQQASAIKGQAAIQSMAALQVNSASIIILNSNFNLQGVQVAVEQLPDIKAIKAVYQKRFARGPGEGYPFPDLSNIYVFKFAENSNMEEIAAAYSQDPSVEYAHPNYIVNGNYTPNDPLWKDQWGPAKIQADQSWDIFSDKQKIGAGKVVAVIDTGLDYNHEDIIGNVWINSKEQPGDANRDNCPGICGIDDDNDGLIDEDGYGCGADGKNIRGEFCTYQDAFDNDDDENGFNDDFKGWDFVNNDSDPLDDNRHGTHVSGTVSAVTDNGIGMAGVAWKNKIMAVKFLNAAGSGNINGAQDAILYAAANGADIMNNSWSIDERTPSIPSLEEVIRTAYGLGIVMVFAAGNVNDDVRYYSPQNMGETFTVAATQLDDQRASFSNYGFQVDLAAPGVNILSLKTGGGYLNLSGTSMAAPHASGLMAMLLSYHEDIKKNIITVEQIRQIVKESANTITTDKPIGAGRINAYKAMQQPVSSLVAKILEPTGAVDLGDNVNIRGTAFGPEGATYQIFYVPQNAPNDPTKRTYLTQSPQPATAKNITLVSNWDTTLVPDGEYVLVLEVAQGNIPQKDMVPFTVNNSYISLPTDGDVFGKDTVIKVHGRATGGRFLRYEIDYAPANDPCLTNGQPCQTAGISFTNPGIDDKSERELGYLDLNFFPSDGNYVLRLIVYPDSQNQSLKSINLVSIRIDARIKQGWPYSTGASIHSSPALADLNNDEKLDVVVTSDDGNIYALDYAGNKLWSLKLDDAVIIETSPVVGDIDPQNPGLEVAFGYGNKDKKTGTLCVLDKQGKLLWKYKIPDWIESNSPAIGDLDPNKDGLEVGIVTYMHILHVFDKLGNLLWSKDIDSNYDRNNSTPVLVDINEDGFLELVVSGGNHLFVFDYRGQELWKSKGSDAGPFPVGIGNLSDKKGYEVVTAQRCHAIYAYDSQGNYLWENYYFTEECNSSGITLGNLDGQGNDLQIIAGDENGGSEPGQGNIYVLDSQRNKIWSYKTVSGGINTPAALGDLNGDGKLEIIVHDRGGKLSVLDYQGQLMGDFQTGKAISKFPQGQKVSSPVLGDLDGDGKMEIVFGGLDGKVYVVEWPESYEDSPRVPWPTFQHDSQRSGLYGGPPVVAKPQKPDLVVSEGPSVAQGQLIEGETISFKARILNQGTVRADKLFESRYDVDFQNSNFDYFNPEVTLKPNPQISNLDPGSNNAIEVFSGELANIPGGNHLIRLCVDEPSQTIDEGNENNNCTITKIEVGLKTSGWSFQTGQAVHSSPTLVDINNDKKLEVIIASDDGNIYALDYAGNKLWSYNPPEAKVIESSPVVGDIDPQRTGLEIAFSYGNNGLRTGTICVLDNQGHLLWEYKIPAWLDVESPTIGDLDPNKDGLEIIIGTKSHSLFVLDKGGSLLWKTTVDQGWEPHNLTPVLADINADGFLDVVVAGGNNLFVFDYRGQQLWKSFGSDASSYPVSIGELDNYKQGLEIVVGRKCLSILAYDSQGNYLWENKYVYLDGCELAGSTLGNLDGQGNDLQIIAGDAGNVGIGHIHALDSHGNRIWSFTMNGEVNMPGALGDLNGDGKLEIVVQDKGGRVSVLDYEGKLKRSFQIGKDISMWPQGYHVSSPALGDLDGDGKMEIVFGGLDGKVYAIEWTESYGNSPRAPWPTFQQNNQRTGLYSQPSLPGLTVWPGDTNNNGVVNQADVLPLGLYWNKTGPARANRSTQWQGQAAAPWNPANATYADANGDGVVNQADILPIGLNWGKRHP